MDKLLDLYSDYLISSFGQTTATGLSKLLGGAISHDQITRFLAGKEHTSTDLWRLVKPYVRQVQNDDGAVIDSIAEKPFTDEDNIVCWHDDHSRNCVVKGINFVTALYYSQGVSLPVGFALVAKTEYYVDKKDGNQKRRSPISKNEYYRNLLQQSAPTVSSGWDRDGGTIATGRAVFSISCCAISPSRACTDCAPGCGRHSKRCAPIIEICAKRRIGCTKSRRRSTPPPTPTHGPGSANRMASRAGDDSDRE